MASGYYPLDPRYDGGKALKKIADELRDLLVNRGDDGPLPAAYNNNDPENAASDGHYEGGLFLALKLIEDCLETP